MKADTIFKRSYNDALDLVAKVPPGDCLPSEVRLCLALDVSRTTVRKVLRALAEASLISDPATKRRLPTAAASSIRFQESETIPRAKRFEQEVMTYLLRDNARPGTLINELDLARRFGVATTLVREFLNRFQRVGLIDKRPNGRWVFKGFTARFAIELFEIREMFELRSARLAAALPEGDPFWSSLIDLRDRHVSLMARIERDFAQFPDLDSAFHQLINAAHPNRFIEGFFDIITLIFHYHYQWNKADERQRNAVALAEHVAYIDALVSRNPDRVEAACKAHLASARHTLLRATRG
ncbi:GntR family transcriptional regulator [Rhodobacter sp. SY28-1]|uniref:GntR family transcriptional regulator n=1 Tax=Rhodobacter sp. SY28-1 TaxID=2562317 RepID=UPI0010C05AF9|nr:GntR family transcriptional regulator [Rhodobacter sp. SY28-1]